MKTTTTTATTTTTTTKIIDTKHAQKASTLYPCNII